MPNLAGVILYEILPDGCLNGIFSNDHPGGFINDLTGKIGNRKFNEIARKKRPLVKGKEDGVLPNWPVDITGEYASSYMDLLNERCPCVLKISHGHIRRNKRACEYDFKWRNMAGKDIFEGSGWLFNNQIVVSYRDL